MTDAQQILRAALDATGRSQVRLAIDVFGINDRTFRGWLAGEPTWPPIVRLAWLLAEHPTLADELEEHFHPSAAQKAVATKLDRDPNAHRTAAKKAAATKRAKRTAE